jgi:hypothetical protein
MHDLVLAGRDRCEGSAPLDKPSHEKVPGDRLSGGMAFKLQVIHHLRAVEATVDCSGDPAATFLASLTVSVRDVMSSCCLSGSTVNTLMCVTIPVPDSMVAMCVPLAVLVVAIVLERARQGVERHSRCLTFDMSSGRRQAELAGGRPLEGVRHCALLCHGCFGD